MNFKTIKTIANVVITIAGIATTIYETKKMVKEVKENIDSNIEAQVRENTGDETFNLKEYNENKSKSINIEKKKSNVNITVDIDGMSVRRYAILKIAKYFFQLFGVSCILYYISRKFKLLKLIKFPNIFKKKVGVLV